MATHNKSLSCMSAKKDCVPSLLPNDRRVQLVTRQRTTRLAAASECRLSILIGWLNFCVPPVASPRRPKVRRWQLPHHLAGPYIPESDGPGISVSGCTTRCFSAWTVRGLYGTCGSKMHFRMFSSCARKYHGVRTSRCRRIEFAALFRQKVLL